MPLKDKSSKRGSVLFLGESANEVTGSAYLVSHKQYQILLDFGMVQGHGDIYTNYKANYDQCHSVRPKLIDSVIVSHANIDHHGLVPYLYSRGCKAPIFVVEGTKKFLRHLWEDSYNIMLSDSAKIEKKRGRKAPILYEPKDIEKALSYVVEIPFNYEININPDVSFEFLKAGHIIHAGSIYMTLRRGYIKTNIWYSGDIGPDKKQLYVEERQSPKRFDIGIMENTYNKPSRINKLRDREKDLEKIESIINEYDRTIFPSFALNRTQVILTELYRLWKDNKIPQDIKVVLDAPLAIRLSNIWDGDGWNEVWEWDNLIKITDFKESQEIQKDKSKMIVICGSGMCNFGRIVSWLQSSLENSKAHLVFIGYCPPEGLADDIKTNKRYITINDMCLENKMNYTELRSFSSHASREELIELYSSLEGQKFCIVHGDSEFKPQFCNDLQEELYKQSKSTRVICTAKGQKIYF